MKNKVVLTGIILLSALFIKATEKPVIKVDFDISGRSSSEVTEPGYTSWVVPQGLSDTKTIDGVQFEIKAVNLKSSDAILRSGWKKALIQSPYYARLANDGVSFDPYEAYGDIELHIKGLPAGGNTIQAYLNSWRDTSSWESYPVNVYVDGVKVHSSIYRSHTVESNSKATVLLSKINIKNDGDEAVILFAVDTTYIPAGNKKYMERCVSIDGFEINTVSVSKIATYPYPEDGDMHADADDGNITLNWSSPYGVKNHILYFGTDFSAVDSASGKTSDVYKGTLSAIDTSYFINGLYNMNTYYWRVDEEDMDGNVTNGPVWSFRPRHLAFKGAEGYGRFAIGGRGGKVVYVTNLNDSGPGSFREALTNEIGPRTIVFAVSGIIKLKSRLTCSSKYVTIAGQTAPGKGICIRSAPFGVGGDGICRFLRVRIGGGQTYDGLGMAGAQNSITDHCSISWTIDEAFSSRNAKNMTLQRTLISEALNIAGHKNYPAGTKHGYAATIGGDIGSFHHNLLAHCEGRNWSLGGGLDGNGYYAGRLDIFNNVVYNWGHRATDGGAHEVNFVNNYYKKGPATSQNTILKAQLEGAGKGSQSYYYSGNVISRTDGTIEADGTDNTAGRKYVTSNGQIVDWDVWVNKPFFPSYANIEPAKNAYKSVLSDVGCNMPVFDEHDRRMIQETMGGSYTYKGSVSGDKGLIDNESDAGGYEDYPEEVRASDFDSDLDGLPDWWEKLHGTNPNSGEGDFSDANSDTDHDGYTALEEYLQWMSVPHFYTDKNKKDTIDLAPFAFAYADSPEYKATCENASVSISGSNLIVTPATDFTGIIYPDFTVTDSEGSSMTRSIGLCITENGPNSLNEVTEGAGVSVYPGVFDDKLNISIDVNNIKSLNVSLYDLSGRNVINKNFKVSSGNGSLSLGGLHEISPGLYLIKITDADTGFDYVVERVIKK